MKRGSGLQRILGQTTPARAPGSWNLGPIDEEWPVALISSPFIRFLRWACSDQEQIKKTNKATWFMYTHSSPMSNRLLMDGLTRCPTLSEFRLPIAAVRLQASNGKLWTPCFGLQAFELQMERSIRIEKGLTGFQWNSVRRTSEAGLCEDATRQQPAGASRQQFRKIRN